MIFRTYVFIIGEVASDRWIKSGWSSDGYDIRMVEAAIVVGSTTCNHRTRRLAHIARLAHVSLLFTLIHFTPLLTSICLTPLLPCLPGSRFSSDFYTMPIRMSPKISESDIRLSQANAVGPNKLPMLSTASHQTSPTRGFADAAPELQSPLGSVRETITVLILKLKGIPFIGLRRLHEIENIDIANHLIIPSRWSLGSYVFR